MGKLNDEQMHKLDDDHHHMLHALEAEAKNTPRPSAPEIGWFRHT